MSTHIIECVFVKIKMETLKLDRDCIIGVIYKPPNSNIKEFSNTINNANYT